MDFLRSYFFKNEPLISWTFLSSKLDSPGIKILERHFFTLSECLSNVLIPGESNFDEEKYIIISYNFDERNGQEMFNWSEVHS